MSTYNFIHNNQIDFIPLSTIFIDKYMPKANPTFVKVYLYGLRYSFNKEYKIKNKNIASALNILESDVINAWKYWDSIGVVNLIIKENDDNSAPSNFNVEFINISSNYKSESAFTTIITSEMKPSYTPEEISLSIEQNESIRFLYDYAQKKLSKLLSSSDIITLYGLHDWLNLPIEVIIMLIEYCISINKTNIRYIEKVAIDWANKGLNDIERVEQYLITIEKKNKLIYKIKKIFGIYERSLSSPEKTYILKWTNELGFNDELIEAAYNLTVLNTGKLSFPYLNSILESWHKQGIKTMKAVNEDKQEHSELISKKGLANSKIKTFKRPNKFINFTQRKYDFKEIERLAREKTIKNLNESR